MTRRMEPHHRHAPDAHAGHGAHMVRDMLRRFVGSAILTVPIVLYSPLGTSLFGRELAPPFGLSPGLLSFILTSIVVWWGGWPFVSSAARSLRQRSEEHTSGLQSHSDLVCRPLLEKK